MPTFLKYFPVTMELGVLTDIKWNNILGLFIWSLVLPMTYIDNDILLAMSHQQVCDAELPESFHPQHSLVMVKLFPSAPVYALTTVYVPTVQERLHLLSVLTSLHNLQMEAVALVYMPKSCMYMPEPSSSLNQGQEHFHVRGHRQSCTYSCQENQKNKEPRQVGPHTLAACRGGWHASKQICFGSARDERLPPELLV